MRAVKQNLSFRENNVLSSSMQQSLASLHLEGIELSKETISDLHLFDTGQLSKDDVLKRAIERARD